MASQTTSKRNIKSDVVDFSNNSVSNGANLFNIVLERGNEGSEATVKQLLELIEKMPRPSRWQGSGDEHDEELKAFQSEWSLDSDLSIDWDDPEETSNPTIFYGLARQTNIEFRDNFFPGLRPFEDDAAIAIRQYPGPATASVMQSLSFPHQKELFNWAESQHSQLLWVDGRFDPIAESDWTTDLALEVVGTVTLAISRRNADDMALVHHFCGPATEDTERTPEVVLQDLIFQLITGYAADKFTQANCRQYRLTRSTFHDAAKPRHFVDLWKLFATCVYILKIRSLVIVLSDMDRLPSHTQAFAQLVDGLVKLSQKDNIQSKILVTTRPSKASDLFGEKYAKTPRQTLIELPASLDRRSLPSRSTRQFRLPIRAKSQLDMASSDIIDSSSEDDAEVKRAETAVAKRNEAFYTFTDNEDSDLDYEHDLQHYLDTDSEDEDGLHFEEKPHGQLDHASAAKEVPQAEPQKQAPEQAQVEDDSDDSLSFNDLHVDTFSKEITALKSLDAAGLDQLLGDSSSEEEL
ncbi:hypothetical protein LIA77_06821 [Sarocladium implicatum]|nr:hypothetical protein LIA77_06821 [Sarocladium implicatum]